MRRAVAVMPGPKSEEWSGLNSEEPPHTVDVQQADMQRCQEAAENCSVLKYRKYRSRLGGVKSRHRRQVLQDMARPLKHWLYKHRDNPYPTKTEKVLLALGSHMTLVQVSNWFANARRRLKNTVRQPDLSWALRIKLYNQYVQGNAERLSVCSDDTNSDDEDCTLLSPNSQSTFGRLSTHHSLCDKQGDVLAIADCTSSDDNASPPSKYKSSLLNRYLNDTVRHMMASKPDSNTTHTTRSHSESFSSIECDQDVVSPASSSETEANFVYHMDASDYTLPKSERTQSTHMKPHQNWREIHAAVALTSLAQTQNNSQMGHTATGQTFSVSRATLTSRLCLTRPGLKQTTETRPTSRIIQKSSHISEVQTVKVPLANIGFKC